MNRENLPAEELTTLERMLKGMLGLTSDMLPNSVRVCSAGLRMQYDVRRIKASNKNITNITLGFAVS